MNTSQLKGVAKQTVSDFGEDRAMRLAAALACYTILSLAPLIVVTLKVVSILPGVGPGVVESQLDQLVGQAGAKAIGDMIANAQAPGSGTLATIVSLIILLFSASGVFAELQDSMNTIWEVKPKPTLGWMSTIKKRFLSMGMVFAIIFLLLVSMLVTGALHAVVDRVLGGGDGQAGFFATAFSYVVEFVSTVLVVWLAFMAIFKYLPDVKIPWRDVWLGALVTAVLFKIGQYLLAIYFAYGSTTSAYGAAGSLVAVLLWAYYSACILFVGAEFTQAYVHAQGRRIVPDEDAVPVTEEQRAQQGLVRQHDLETAEHGGAALAAQRGAPYPRPAVPQRRIVTITRPAPESNKAYAVAGLGLAAGFVVGAIGMLTGRKYTAGGIEQLALDRRLDELESSLRGRDPELLATAIRVQDRLEALDARLRSAGDPASRRRANGAPAPQARPFTATLKERFDAAVERQERKRHPGVIDRLTGHRRRPTLFERFSELVS